jgi:hypothetical protein
MLTKLNKKEIQSSALKRIAAPTPAAICSGKLSVARTSAQDGF